MKMFEVVTGLVDAATPEKLAADSFIIDNEGILYFRKHPNASDKIYVAAYKVWVSVKEIK